MLPTQRKTLLDTLANVLTVIVAIAFIGVLANRYLLPNANDRKAPTVGRAIYIQGFDPTASKKNVLLVLMKGCRFCEGSMEFYKEILRAGSDQQTNVIAVFPPKTEEAEIYLKQFGLDSLPVLFAPLEELEVDGTPTIILTDASGKVTNFWIGQLSKEKEREVLRSISS